MKTSTLLILILVFLSACYKGNGEIPVISSSTINSKNDTIPDNARLKLKLIKDSVNSDETMFQFNHLSSLNLNQRDAPYLTGFGQESLASITSDGRDLAINNLPFSPGMSIDLDINMKSTGAYSLQVDYNENIPGYIQIWLKDTYLKDSINLLNKNYYFNVVKTDSNSFGNKRFKIVLKVVQNIQTNLPQ